MTLQRKKVLRTRRVSTRKIVAAPAQRVGAIRGGELVAGDCGQRCPQDCDKLVSQARTARPMRRARKLNTARFRRR